MGGEKLIRTEDGLQFEVTTDERWSVAASEFGQLVPNNPQFDGITREFASTVGRAVRESGASRATVQFGVGVNSEGAAFITRGIEGAHAVISLEYSTDTSGTSLS